mmetsp:Transcript_50524/g.110548  ORF Transcript_50524/g.110548 Transcript_50524/m.110548 type:complete len:234 (+) Transcript_50524:90-791(+)
MRCLAFFVFGLGQATLLHKSSVKATKVAQPDESDDGYTHADDDSNDVTDYSPEQFMNSDGDDDESAFLQIMAQAGVKVDLQRFGEQLETALKAGMGNDDNDDDASQDEDVDGSSSKQSLFSDDVKDTLSDPDRMKDAMNLDEWKHQAHDEIMKAMVSGDGPADDEEVVKSEDPSEYEYGTDGGAAAGDETEFLQAHGDGDGDDGYTHADDDNNDVTDYSPEQFMGDNSDDGDE